MKNVRFQQSWRWLYAEVKLDLQVLVVCSLLRFLLEKIAFVLVLLYFVVVTCLIWTKLLVANFADTFGLG